jgi:hypothetical protein
VEKDWSEVSVSVRPLACPFSMGPRLRLPGAVSSPSLQVPPHRSKEEVLFSFGDSPRPLQGYATATSFFPKTRALGSD